MKLALGGALATGCSRPRGREANSSRPRYWILALLSGGHDTLYTTDPKTATQVDQFVTLPTDNRVTQSAIPFGPHFAPLAAWADQLTVLNGIQVRTANHDTGQKQFFHLKTNINDGVPSVLDIIAAHRSTQPLGVAYLNLSQRSMHSPAYFGTADRFYFGEGDVFDAISRAKPGELEHLQRVYAKRSDELMRKASGSREVQQTAKYMREVSDFFAEVQHVPGLVPLERSNDYVAQSMSETLERALWLIQHDLCSGVVLDLGLLGWDSHFKNESKQQEMSSNFVSYFNEFLQQLHTRTNRFGPLASQTVTVVGSELGRFPHQNDMLGKDHMPQTSFLFHGLPFRAGRVFGRTGLRMEGLGISYRDGALANGGRVPLLDDVGTTMLKIAGLDPERYGYTGRSCDFLLDRT